MGIVAVSVIVPLQAKTTVSPAPPPLAMISTNRPGAPLGAEQSLTVTVALPDGE